MRKIHQRYLRIGKVLGLVIAVLAMGTLLPETTIAGQRTDKDLPLVDGETQLFPGYPRQFDGVGFIDRMGEGEIVIDDGLRKLPSSADLHTPRNRHAGKSSFGVGDYVGYQLDEAEAIESLWLLKKGKR